MKSKTKRLQWAKDYVNYCLKEGVQWDEDEIAKMSDDQLILFAEYQADRADAYADQMRKGE